MLVLFLLLAFLEACGYMSRIAFVLDRVFRKFGLSGKSFIPMLIGTGCGSSITKGAGLPENILVFLSMRPEMMMAAMPMK